MGDGPCFKKCDSWRHLGPDALLQQLKQQYTAFGDNCGPYDPEVDIREISEADQNTALLEAILRIDARTWCCWTKGCRSCTLATDLVVVIGV